MRPIGNFSDVYLIVIIKILNSCQYLKRSDGVRAVYRVPMQVSSGLIRRLTILNRAFSLDGSLIDAKGDAHENHTLF